jgi:two-component sensor histidine kinase
MVAPSRALHSTLDNDGSVEVSMPSYLTALSDTIKNSFGDWIAFETVIEPSIKLDHRRAQFVGLIYAEAAMNTVKYAFPNAWRKLRISILRPGMEAPSS